MKSVLSFDRISNISDLLILPQAFYNGLISISRNSYHKYYINTSMKWELHIEHYKINMTHTYIKNTLTKLNQNFSAANFVM